MSKVRVCVICGAKKADGPIQRRLEDDFEPCAKCRKKYLSKGVLLVEAIEDKVHPENTPTMTGSVLVLKNDAFKQLFEMPIPPRKIAFVEVGIIEMIANELKK